MGSHGVTTQPNTAHADSLAPRASLASDDSLDDDVALPLHRDIPETCLNVRWILVVCGIGINASATACLCHLLSFTAKTVLLWGWFCLIN